MRVETVEGLFAEVSFSAYPRHYNEGSFGFAYRSKKCKKGGDERLLKSAAKTLLLWLLRQAWRPLLFALSAPCGATVSDKDLFPPP